MQSIWKKLNNVDFAPLHSLSSLTLLWWFHLNLIQICSTSDREYKALWMIDALIHFFLCQIWVCCFFADHSDFCITYKGIIETAACPLQKMSSQSWNVLVEFERHIPTIKISSWGNHIVVMLDHDKWLLCLPLMSISE